MRALPALETRGVYIHEVFPKKHLGLFGGYLILILSLFFVFFQTLNFIAGMSEDDKVLIFVGKKVK